MQSLILLIALILVICVFCCAYDDPKLSTRTGVTETRTGVMGTRTGVMGTRSVQDMITDEYPDEELYDQGNSRLMKLRSYSQKYDVPYRLNLNTQEEFGLYDDSATNWSCEHNRPVESVFRTFSQNRFTFPETGFRWQRCHECDYEHDKLIEDGRSLVRDLNVEPMPRKYLDKKLGEPCFED